MLNNIYIVESPLQLISAIEAAQRFKSESEDYYSILIIRFDAAGRENNNQQIRSLIHAFSWDEIIDFTDRKLSSLITHLLRRIKIKQIASKYGKNTNYLCIGEFRSEWMHYIRHVLTPRKTFLLDDGAVTIQVQSEYLAKGMNFPTLHKRKFIERMAHKFIYFGFMNRTVLNKPINLFTSFSLTPLVNQEVIKHSYESLRASYDGNEQYEVNEIWFFGSKYSEAGILAEEDELALLEKVKAQLNINNCELKYIPHRDESSEKLQLIKTKLEIDIKRFDVPAEIQLIQGKIRPKGIAGYYTTVLLSSAVLRPNIELYPFRIPQNMIKEKYSIAIQNIYDFLEHSQIKIFDLTYDNDADKA